MIAEALNINTTDTDALAVLEEEVGVVTTDTAAAAEHNGVGAELLRSRRQH